MRRFPPLFVLALDAGGATTAPMPLRHLLLPLCLALAACGSGEKPAAPDDARSDEAAAVRDASAMVAAGRPAPAGDSTATPSPR